MREVGSVTAMIGGVLRGQRVAIQGTGVGSQ